MTPKIGGARNPLISSPFLYSPSSHFSKTSLPFIFPLSSQSPTSLPFSYVFSFFPFQPFPLEILPQTEFVGRYELSSKGTGTAFCPVAVYGDVDISGIAKTINIYNCQICVGG